MNLTEWTGHKEVVETYAREALNENTEEEVTSPISDKTCEHTKITEGCDCCYEWAFGTPEPQHPCPECEEE